MNNNLVCYLFTKFDNKKSILEFIKYYKKYSSGVKHTLLICFKLLDQQKINSLKKSLKNVSYIEFIDNSSLNDYDFGSYKRVAESYPKYNILFLNSHSYPLHNLWFKKLLYHFDKNTVIGTTASNESLLSSLKLKKIYKIFSFFKKKIQYKKKFIEFPNPHIRTSNFLIKGNDLLSFLKNRNFYNKEDAWMAESGINGMTNFFKKKKFNIYVVNSDGKKFIQRNWKNSETYNYALQAKTLISDKHTRKYSKLSKKSRIISERICWG